MALSAPGAGVSTVGCSSGCDTGGGDDPGILYEGGRTEGPFYETNGFNERFLIFPAGRRYRFAHGLGQVPRHIAVYLSFQENPLTVGSSVALAAGNQALIERVDGEVVQVRNDTCADFYLRLEASAPESQP